MYIDATRIRDEVWCWERDRNGELFTNVVPAPYYCYMKSATPEAVSIFGDPVKRVDFESFKEFKDFKSHRNDLFESDIAPEYKHLSDTYHSTDTEVPVHIGFFDIEVDFNLKDGLGYPRPENPFGEINAISLFDTAKGEYHMLMFDTPELNKVTLKDPDGEYPVIIHRTRNERDLLLCFADVIKDIDILTAWNGDKFDIPYIMARATKHFGASAPSLLCRDDFLAKSSEKVDAFGNDFTKWELVGRLHLDMLDIYKKFTYEVKRSYALNAIAEEELGEKKTDYDDNLGELYRNDPQTFFEYSLQDARLLKKLNDKKRIIELLIQLGRKATIRFPDVLGTVKMIESLVVNYCHTHDPNQLVVVPDKKDHDKETLEGGYVYETMTGRHEWMASYDLTSLYPSVMMMLGISPETYIFQAKNRFQDYIKIVTESEDEVVLQAVGQHVDYRHLKGEDFHFTGKEAMEFIREQGYCISANGCIFTGKDGFVSRVIRNGFETRKHYKVMMKEAAKAGDKEKEALYDLYQMASKIVINSAYGAITNNHFRFFDIDLGKSITLTGQIISKAQMKMVNDTIKEAGECLEQ